MFRIYTCRYYLVTSLYLLYQEFYLRYKTGLFIFLFPLKPLGACATSLRTCQPYNTWLINVIDGWGREKYSSHTKHRHSFSESESLTPNQIQSVTLINWQNQTHSTTFGDTETLRYTPPKKEFPSPQSHMLSNDWQNLMSESSEIFKLWPGLFGSRSELCKMCINDN